MNHPQRDDVWLVSLDSVTGSDIRKTRPCLVISPDEMNDHLRTVIVAPMITAERPYPTRVALSFQGKHGQVALDQVRAVDRQRLLKRLGAIPPASQIFASAGIVGRDGLPRAGWAPAPVRTCVQARRVFNPPQVANLPYRSSRS